jgi:ArsR family transcriptional regulator
MSGKGTLTPGGYTSDFCSRRLKTIADRTRWDVLVQLVQGARTVTELNGSLRIDQTLLSHHLRILRDEGFVEVTREGKSKRYRLAEAVRPTPSGLGLDLGCCRLELHPPRRRARRAEAT